MTTVAQIRPLEPAPDFDAPMEPFDALADHLATPRQMAAAFLVAAGADPAMIVDVGAFQGELLEAFLVRFPAARAQWTDAGDNSLATARKRLERFDDRVAFRIGCPRRDVSDGTVPADTDVLTTSWVSSHRPADEIDAFYRDAAGCLKVGGWIVHLEHVGFDDPVLEARILRTRSDFHVSWEGPPAHHPGRIATRDEHLSGLRAAGFADSVVVWESLGTALFIGSKAS